MYSRTKSKLCLKTLFKKTKPGEMKTTSVFFFMKKTLLTWAGEILQLKVLDITCIHELNPAESISIPES